MPRRKIHFSSIFTQQHKIPRRVCGERDYGNEGESRRQWEHIKIIWTINNKNTILICLNIHNTMNKMRRGPENGRKQWGKGKFNFGSSSSEVFWLAHNCGSISVPRWRRSRAWVNAPFFMMSVSAQEPSENLRANKKFSINPTPWIKSNIVNLIHRSSGCFIEIFPFFFQPALLRSCIVWDDDERKSRKHVVCWCFLFTLETFFNSSLAEHFDDESTSSLLPLLGVSIDGRKRIDLSCEDNKVKIWQTTTATSAQVRLEIQR